MNLCSANSTSKFFKKKDYGVYTYSAYICIHFNVNFIKLILSYYSGDDHRIHGENRYDQHGLQRKRGERNRHPVLEELQKISATDRDRFTNLRSLDTYAYGSPLVPLLMGGLSKKKNIEKRYLLK